MMNYIKSECYRVLRDRGIYAVTGLLAALPVLYNVILWAFGRMDGESFRYATRSFSYSAIVSSPMMYCVIAAVIAMLLYDGNRKNGNLKNTVAFGISREKIFAGECIVAAGTCLLILIPVLGTYAISTQLLLGQSGPVTFMDLLMEVPAVFFIAVAALILAILCMEMFEKTAAWILVWVSVWFVVPKILLYLGLRFRTVYEIAMWLPENFFGLAGMSVNMQECITAWDTAAGMAKCMLSGAAGIVLFGTMGVLMLRKKEL